jgi:hypothetical protein
MVVPFHGKLRDGDVWLIYVDREEVDFLWRRETSLEHAKTDADSTALGTESEAAR